MIKKLFIKVFGNNGKGRRQTYIRKTAFRSCEVVAIGKQGFRTNEERENFFKAVCFSRSHI